MPKSNVNVFKSHQFFGRNGVYPPQILTAALSLGNHANFLSLSFLIYEVKLMILALSTSLG
jgi:hypothetical protein